MRPIDVEILEDLMDDDVTEAELGLSIDLTRDDLEESDELGFRTLYENPENVIRSSRYRSRARAT